MMHSRPFAQTFQRWRRRHPGLLTQAGIVAGVLVVTLALAIRLTPVQGLAVIALFVMAAGAWVVLRQPGWGLIALIPASLLVSFSIGTGTESNINMPMLLLIGLFGLMLLDRLVIQRRLALPPSRTLVPLALLLTFAVLAFIVGQLPWFPLAQHAPLRAQIGGLAIIFLSAIAYLLPAMQIDDMRWLRRLTWVFLGIGSVFVIGQMIPGVKPWLLRTYPIGSTSSQFWVWMTALAGGQAFFNRRMRPALRLGLGALALFTIISAYYVIPGWKSGWVPSLAVFFVLFLMHSGRVAVVAVAAALIALPRFIALLIATDEYSYTTRTEAWKLITQIAKANPILGLGPANYYWYTPLVRISGYYGLKFNSHNQYIDLFAQMGVLGLAAFIWFTGEVGRLGWRLSRLTQGFARGYVYGALAGLAGMLVAGMFGDWILPFVYNVGFVGFRASFFGWLFLGGLVALERLQARSAEDEEGAAA
jgi:O-antigen ligase